MVLNVDEIIKHMECMWEIKQGETIQKAGVLISIFLSNPQWEPSALILRIALLQ